MKPFGNHLIKTKNQKTGLEIDEFLLPLTDERGGGFGDGAIRRGLADEDHLDLIEPADAP